MNFAFAFAFFAAAYCLFHATDSVIANFTTSPNYEDGPPHMSLITDAILYMIAFIPALLLLGVPLSLHFLVLLILIALPHLSIPSRRLQYLDFALVALWMAHSAH